MCLGASVRPSRTRWVLPWCARHRRRVDPPPGSADRVVLADGGRAFVKAVSARANPDSIGAHRREARVLSTLAGHGLPLADLLGVVDQGTGSR